MNLRALFNREVASQPIEVGDVNWERDLDTALGASVATGKPVFALFQEVPGCAGCKQFGEDVLSDPAVVDGIEELFVPFLVHNNSAGPDSELLEAFGEPAWNYQVVRFLDASGADVIPRRDRVWETGPLTARMIETLTTTGRGVPNYLRLVEQAHSDRLEVAHFAQPCFWVGEMELGQIDGVVATQAAFMAGNEVTTIWFDPDEISLADLSLQAKRRNVASIVFTDAGAELASRDLDVRPVDEASHRVAPNSDQHRQLRGVRGLENLSVSQRTKVNSFLPSAPGRADEFLPPSLRRLLPR